MVEPSHHRLETIPNSRWVSRAADLLAMGITTTLAQRSQCVVGLSGGSTPTPVFDALAGRALPWTRIVFTQVDERLAPIGSPERNLTAQRGALGDLGAHWVPLPVGDDGAEPDAGQLERFGENLEAITGMPPVLDVVHLGLGDDGHTASLVPGDPILDETDADVGLTLEYRGSRRLTMTRPMLDRSRLAIWLVSGSNKAAPLARLVAGDSSIPAGLLAPTESVIVADSSARPI